MPTLSSDRRFLITAAGNKSAGKGRNQFLPAYCWKLIKTRRRLGIITTGISCWHNLTILPPASPDWIAVAQVAQWVSPHPCIWHCRLLCLLCPGPFGFAIVFQPITNVVGGSPLLLQTADKSFCTDLPLLYLWSCTSMNNRGPRDTTGTIMPR